MLISFALPAQEKPISKEHSEKKSTEINRNSKDTIPAVKPVTNSIKPVTSSPHVIICGPSKSKLMEPLYIMDEEIIDSKKFSKINPNDIESVKVLKGAEATKIYGNKGANGVIIITMKVED